MFRLLAGTAAVTAVAATDAVYPPPQAKGGYGGGNTGYAPQGQGGYGGGYNPQAKGGYGGDNSGYAPKAKGGYGDDNAGYAPKGKSGYGGDNYAPQGKGGYGYGRKAITFPPAYAIIDPNYYNSIFTGYQNCVATKCDVLPSDYSATGINDCISTIAGYTSCVTACAAGQALETVEDFRTLLESVIEIGNDQLRQARVYLSGLGDLDVIGERVHIGESCCLPNSYFASWERIMIPVATKLKKADADQGNSYNPRYPAPPVANPDDETTPYMMSAADYISFCTSADSGTKFEWLDKKVICADTTKATYLQALQRNLGHLILAPSCVTDAPDGACCDDAHPNPRATPFRGDVCVATTYEANGKTKTLTTPLIKPTAVSKKQGRRYDPCPCDEIDEGTGDNKTPKRIRYDFVSGRDLLYYTVTGGLPSDYVEAGVDGPSTCTYNVGLATPTIDGFFKDIAPITVPLFLASDEGGEELGISITDGAIKAVRYCPTDGLLEYCNVDQYASFLEYQLFDHANCDIADLRTQHTDYSSSYQTIACLYKIFSLKCDCMEAVLSCYSVSSHYASSLSKVIGQAASILCGFVLCQRPNVYSLFGDEYAIDRASLMRQLLTSAGIFSAGSLSPAAAVLLSFGLGMVALVVAKKVAAAKKAKTVDIDEGYHTLL
ncbi:hypothetical protein SDRG_09233 [Saprolegnia diclina VS20]|uniref:Niemann-Pick C1 N-terminal domain-containing protein n=1 Tax=Saprolegnia diclina (strain VS20) TaxID=1156394 RepID=T0QHS1_SAPDV|nr:hypothetical protein SDRG_09233 [Saprolegnia diclina VS20]EQC33250.1 hypothetical protein SDRG_09233 [Saprolegnia diclina VS20]|eukprot:XP_008613373.1 hypothetical protein SDRG_09233 [Saprolegnia diclina VS20]